MTGRSRRTGWVALCLALVAAVPVTGHAAGGPGTGAGVGDPSSPAAVPPPRILVRVHVATTGSDGGDGTLARPWRTISHAVEAAPDGATIVVHGGTYHESVEVDGRALRIVGAAGETVTLDGARPVSGWQRVGTAWYAPGWTAEWPETVGEQIDPAFPMAAHPDLAFLDGVALTQVATKGQLGPGRFWVDDVADRLWIGDDPAGRTLEASDLPWAVRFHDADGSRLVNVTVRRYATPADAMGAVRIDSNDVTVADVLIEDNAYSGVFVIGTDNRLTRLRVRDNAYIGISAHLADGITITRSTVRRNNLERFDAVHSGAGIKVTTSDGITVRQCYVADNLGVGIWADLGAAHVTIVGNVVEHSTHAGILMELSGHVVVADNVVRDTGEAGIWVLETNDAQIWNNAVYENERAIWMEDGPRTSPDATDLVLWDLERVTLRNNVVGDGRPGAEMLMGVDDWTEVRPASDMDVSVDTTAYWMPQGNPTHLSRWARWPQPLAISDTLEEHRAATRQDRAGLWSRASVNPYARDPAGWDFRTPRGVGAGAAANVPVARALGVPLGTPLRIGPRYHRIPGSLGVVVP